MGIKQKVSLEFVCDCNECHKDGCGPLKGVYNGETMAECYKAAVNSGWRFLKGRNGNILTIHLDCVFDL